MIVNVQEYNLYITNENLRIDRSRLFLLMMAGGLVDHFIGIWRKLQVINYHLLFEKKVNDHKRFLKTQYISAY
jgi:hypothetical protein